MKLPLLGGAYTARSIIADAQRCVNLYPEKNPGDAEMPITHYPTPGLTLLSVGPLATTWRGLYYSTTGILFGVLGKTLYRINDDWTYTALGNLTVSANTPVSMVDNGRYLMLVDGSPNGYTYDMQLLAFAAITDPNFQGGDYVGYVDTFFVLNVPGTNQWYCSLSNSITFDPTYFAAKTGFADPIQALFVIHREAWVIGSQTTEIWSDVGGTSFPFAPLSGVFIQHGCVAKYSVASYGLQMFWLSQDNKGEALVMMGAAYQAKSVTTPAIAQELSSYSVISDAIGFVYQQQGHIFYVLSFPTENKTWVYDASIDLWHERTWTDANGGENRIRPNCCAFAYGKTVVGDWQNGQLYCFDLENYTDNGTPVVRRRGFPHVVMEGARINYLSFIADMEVGTITVDLGSGAGGDFNNDFGPDFSSAASAQPIPPLVSLRWSDTRGKSWGNPVTQSMGKTGQYYTFPTWRRLGYARDRVFELFWSENCAAALNGAYIEIAKEKISNNG